VAPFFKYLESSRSLFHTRRAARAPARRVPTAAALSARWYLTSERHPRHPAPTAPVLNATAARPPNLEANASAHQSNKAHLSAGSVSPATAFRAMPSTFASIFQPSKLLNRAPPDHAAKPRRSRAPSSRHSRHSRNPRVIWGVANRRRTLFWVFSRRRSASHQKKEPRSVENKKDRSARCARERRFKV